MGAEKPNAVPAARASDAEEEHYEIRFCAACDEYVVIKNTVECCPKNHKIVRSDKKAKWSTKSISQYEKSIDAWLAAQKECERRNREQKKTKASPEPASESEKSLAETCLDSVYYNEKNYNKNQLRALHKNLYNDWAVDFVFQKKGVGPTFQPGYLRYVHSENPELYEKRKEILAELGGIADPAEQFYRYMQKYAQAGDCRLIWKFEDRKHFCFDTVKAFVLELIGETNGLHLSNTEKEKLFNKSTYTLFFRIPEAEVDAINKSLWRTKLILEHTNGRLFFDGDDFGAAASFRASLTVFDEISSEKRWKQIDNLKAVIEKRGYECGENVNIKTATEILSAMIGADCGEYLAKADYSFEVEAVSSGLLVEDKKVFPEADSPALSKYLCLCGEACLMNGGHTLTVFELSLSLDGEKAIAEIKEIVRNAYRNHASERGKKAKRNFAIFKLLLLQTNLLELSSTLTECLEDLKSILYKLRECFRETERHYEQLDKAYQLCFDGDYRQLEIRFGGRTNTLLELAEQAVREGTLHTLWKNPEIKKALKIILDDYERISAEIDKKYQECKELVKKFQARST